MASRAREVDPSKAVTSDPDVQPDLTGIVEQAEIAARAYERWQERGCPVGDDQADWFWAEQELKSAMIKGRAIRRVSDSDSNSNGAADEPLAGNHNEAGVEAASESIDSMPMSMAPHPCAFWFTSWWTGVHGFSVAVSNTDCYFG